MKFNDVLKQKLEPERMKYCEKVLTDAGFNVIKQNDGKSLMFYYNNEIITVFPYTGWFTGKGIVDGRGIHNLLRQLK